MRPKLCAMNSIGSDLGQASPHSRGLKTILAAHLKHPHISHRLGYIIHPLPPQLRNNFAGPPGLAES